MTTEAIALITIKDTDKLAAYREHAAEALARHQGRVVGAGPAETLESAFEAPSVAARLAFPTVEHARGWINDPELSDVHAMRNAAGLSTIVILPALTT